MRSDLKINRLISRGLRSRPLGKLPKSPLVLREGGMLVELKRVAGAQEMAGFESQCVI